MMYAVCRNAGTVGRGYLVVVEYMDDWQHDMARAESLVQFLASHDLSRRAVGMPLLHCKIGSRVPSARQDVSDAFVGFVLDG